MPKKPKFKPEITRVKLNPEQAVLTCACYDGFAGFDGFFFQPNNLGFVCHPGVFSKKENSFYWTFSGTIS
jgi:hypothetical protein